MALYGYYFELLPLHSKLNENVLNKPLKIQDAFRRKISVAINTLHHVSIKKSISGYAIAIIESNFDSENSVSVQSLIRVYTKKQTSLEHLHSVLQDVRFFKDIYYIGEIKEVPVSSKNYSAYIRVRVPTKKKQLKSFEIKKSLLESLPDCNYIYLMPSSSIHGSKKLIRYYYKTVPMDFLKTAQYSKPDGYGFSRTTRLCAVANI